MDAVASATVAALAAAAALAVAAVALGVATAVTARRPAAVVDLGGYLRRWRHLHGGYDPAGSVWVHGWLRLSYAVARPLAHAGVRPQAMTAWAVWLAAAAAVGAGAGGRWPLLAAIAVVASALADTLDGCLAVVTARTTRWGYVLDSLADRVSDLLVVAALVAVGGPVGAAIAAGTALFLLEYLRARAANAGAGEIGVVTPAERPNRIIVAVVALAAAGTAPTAAATAATAGLWVTAALSAVGVVQFGVVARRRLAALDDA